MHPPLRRTISAPRAHLATVVAAFAAAGLVTLGVGTGQRASSDSDGGVLAAPAALVDDGPFDRTSDGAGRADIEQDAQLRAPAGSPILDAASIRRIFTGVRTDAGVDMLARLFGCDFRRSTVGCAPVPAGQAAQVALYNGRPIRPVATLRMKVTAYSPDWRSCGESADGITASGYSVLTNGGYMVAADPRVLPLGSLVSVPGYDGGAVVPVLDTGGAIKGNRLDVLYPTHEVAMRWGVQEIDVTVWEYADGLPNGFRRVRRPAR